ncbi:uncharacterized protein LOC115409446 [Salarias fasciatus]|uniref:uncharacterized protein LOC115409446 n=1 Tax=Salarias fasciatus TaxID=181472 RepID=UPI001176DCAD|nr:uncharacterized protein LOC115409446 [Salarias fasciatus]
MGVSPELKAEVISSLCGEPVKLYDSRTFQGRVPPQKLSVDDFLLRTILGNQETYRELFLDVENFFDPDYDYDFTNLSDSDLLCKRGDEYYERPKGWYRMALKVRGKYPDGDDWLGPDGWRRHSVPGEWPVSYHGTSIDGAKGIIKEWYKAGDRDQYGRGVYSTPDIHVADYFATTFSSPTTGKCYKVIMQNRINGDKREKCDEPDYWLIPVESGTPPDEEKSIVERSIRPYGILIKEIRDEGTPAHQDSFCTII